MSKIYSPGIFITTNYGLAKQFSEGVKVSKLVNNTNSLLLSNENNKYLQSFDYSYGYEDKGHPSLKLSFIDVDNNFENEFLDNGIVKNLLSESFKKITQVGGLDKSVTSKLSYVLSSRFRIYFSFGVGDDTKNWGGPYTATLVKVEVEINSSGMRVYRYTFYPTNSYFFRPNLSSEDTNPNQYTELSFMFGNMRTFSHRFTEAKEINDYHKNIKVLLKEYVQKISDTKLGNIIVLLPKINEYVNKKINNEYKSQNSGTDGTDIRQSSIETIKAYKNFGIDCQVVDKNSINNTDCQKEYHFPINTAIPQQDGDRVSEGQNPQKKTNEWFDLDYYLTMVESTEDKTEKEKKVNTPDWWIKLAQVNKGYGWALEEYPSYITAFQENDLKFLKVFKDSGLIEDETEPCTIVGNYQFILDVLYLNQTDFNQAMQAKTSFKYEDTDPLKKILENPGYRSKIIDIKYKHKNNSSFDEEINLDELNFDIGIGSISETPETFKNTISILKQTDIPIFTNNLYNSNVMSLSLENNDTYTNATLHSIRKDRERYLYDMIVKNSDQLLIDTGTLKPEERDMFLKIINENQRLNTPISAKDLARLKAGDGNWETYDFKDTDTLRLLFPNFEKEPSFIDQLLGIYLAELKAIFQNPLKANPVNTLLGGEDVMDKVITKELKEQKEQLKSSNKAGNDLEKVLNLPNNENLTWLSLLLARKIKEYKNSADGNLRGVDDDSLFALSVILMAVNEYNKSTGSVQGSPTVRGANQRNMNAKIFDYLFKYTTTLNLKTLPFFYISNPSFIRKPALFYSKKIQPIRSNTEFPLNSDNIFDYFSGMYTIQGYKHIINTREMYSEFTLLKDLPSSNDKKTLDSLGSK